MEIVPVKLILYIALLVFIIILLASFILVVYLMKKVAKARKSDPQKCIRLVDKYQKLPLDKPVLNNMSLNKLRSLIILKRWEETRFVVDSLNLGWIQKKKRLFQVYIYCLLNLFIEDQVEMARYMMSKIQYVDIPEIKLACAINDYYDGNLDECRFMLQTLVYVQLQPTIYGCLNYYLGLLSVGEEAKKYFKLAMEFGRVATEEKANEMLNKMSDEGDYNE